MNRIDLKAAHKPLYSAPEKAFVLVEAPPLNYLMFDGKGDPDSAPEYRQALEALYALSYTLKFMSKYAFGRDYRVGPLESLWWAADTRAWTMMILQPDWITPQHLRAAMAEVLMKAGLPGVERARLETLHEGLSVQSLHVGAGSCLTPLPQDWLAARDLRENGRRHAICLFDICKTAPAKRRTLLRQPVRRQ